MNEGFVVIARWTMLPDGPNLVAEEMNYWMDLNGMWFTIPYTSVTLIPQNKTGLHPSKRAVMIWNDEVHSALKKNKGKQTNWTHQNFGWKLKNWLWRTLWPDPDGGHTIVLIKQWASEYHQKICWECKFRKWLKNQLNFHWNFKSSKFKSFQTLILCEITLKILSEYYAH